MKKLVWGLAACCFVLSALSLNAGEKRYQIELASTGGLFGKPLAFQEIPPTPEPAQPAAPMPAPVNPPPAGLVPIPDPSFGVPSDGFQTVELYHRVKIEDRDNIHPCAVKKIVAVKDPCAKEEICGSCTPPCVYVMICVPPGEKFKYEVKRKDHSKVEYDYGDYEVEITSKDGVIEVDYDD